MTLANQLENKKINDESWRYTDLSKIVAKVSKLSASSKGILVNNCMNFVHSEQRLVFVNGEFNQAQSSFGGLPKEIIQGDSTQGYSLILAGQTCLITQPIELNFITTKDGPIEINTKLEILLGPSGRLTLFERHDREIGCLPRQVHTLNTLVKLDKQAKFVHGKINKNAGLHFSHTEVHLEYGAFYDNFTLTMGGNLNRNIINIEMINSLAQCDLKGVTMLGGNSHTDTLTRIHHVSPHGTSRQYFKTIAGGQSQGVFQGKIVVAKGAMKTDSQQLSRALLLSNQAEIDMQPNLEIYADDVKCSHGSTVGDIDNNMMFYLRSRGVNEKMARQMLVGAFSEDIIEIIQVSEWRDVCRQEITGWLHENT